MFVEPRWASALVHHQVSRVLWLVLQRVHCHVWVVRHPRSYQQGGATGESTGCGLACPHLQYYPPGLELRLPRRSGALVVRGHQPQRRRWVGPGAQGLGPRHIRFGSPCSLSASTSWRMYMRAAGGWYAAPRVGGDRPPRRR